MIVFLTGTLVEKHPTRLVLSVGGVGYEILIPLSSYDRLPGTGEECTVLTHDYLREDTHHLFGFMSEEERVMFVRFIAVNGIGPKLALSALSGLSVRELKRAIVEGDTKRVSSISGIGKKMAERIVVELRDKIDDAEAWDAVAGDGGTAPDGRLRDVILALVALGYKQAAAGKMARDALRGCAPTDDVETLIRKTLAGGR